jgi:DNA repair protein RadD
VIKPRDYQLEAVTSARAAFRSGAPTALIVLPTGAGKSLTAAEFLRQLLDVKPDYRALIVVPRASIIDSFATAVERLTGIVPTIAASSSHGVDTTGQIVVGMWQTLSRRTLPAFDILIPDEAHRINQAKADSGYYSLITRAQTTGARILGFTATPFRQEGYIFGPGKLFPEPVFSRNLAWTTERGYTVRARLTAPTDDKIAFDTRYLTIDSTGDYSPLTVDALVEDETRLKSQVTDILARTTTRRKVAIACANIKHALAVADELRSRGELVSCVTTDDDVNARHISLGTFETDPATRFLTFVSIVAEGYDYPPTDCIVFLRPTRSTTFYIQCVGRGLRPADGKSDCLVLDYGQVVRNCGPLDRPIVQRETGKSAQIKELTKLPFDILSCKDCGAFLFPDKNAARIVCTECGSENPKPERVVDKNLEKQADKDAALYADEVEGAAYHEDEFEVRSISLEPAYRGKAIKTWLTVNLVNGEQLSFVVNNPHFENHPGKKFFFAKIEREMKKLCRDITGEDVSMRQSGAWRATQRVLIRCKKRVPNVIHTGRPYDRYVSHRVIVSSINEGSRNS